jgi:hypothetical protein
MTVRIAPVQMVLGLMMGLAVARAAPVPLDSLLRNSPFTPPAAAQNGPAVETALEFRGVLVDRGEHFFSIYDPSARSGMWVGLNEAGNPFTVQSYDAEKTTAAVQFRGRVLNLALKQAKVTSLPAQAGPVPLPTNGPGPQPTVNASPQGDEAARLAAVAEEIRRRRALRAQSSMNLPSQPPTPAQRPAPAPPRPN